MKGRFSKNAAGKTGGILRLLVFAAYLLDGTLSSSELEDKTDPGILSKTHEQANLWSEDARRDWVVSTDLWAKIAGSDALIMQCGFLRAEYNTGYLIFIYKKSAEVEELNVLRLPRWGGNYELLAWDESNSDKVIATRNQIVSWMRDVKDGNIKSFRTAKKIDAPSPKPDSGKDGIFAVEVCGHGQCYQFIESNDYDIEDAMLSNLLSWLLVHANAWKADLLENDLGLKYNFLPIKEQGKRGHSEQ